MHAYSKAGVSHTFSITIITFVKISFYKFSVLISLHSYMILPIGSDKDMMESTQLANSQIWVLSNVN